MGIALLKSSLWDYWYIIHKQRVFGKLFLYHPCSNRFTTFFFLIRYILLLHKYLETITVKTRLISLTAIISFLVFMAVTLSFSWVYSQQIYKEKVSEIRKLTEVAEGIILYYAQKQQEGLLTEAQAQNEAIETLRHMTYNDQRGYYFVINYDLYYKLHATLPEVENKYYGDLEDVFGTKFLSMLREKARSNPEGAVGKYWYPKADLDITLNTVSNKKKVYPKISYVKVYEPWQWYFGTGSFIDDINNGLLRGIFLSASISLLLTLAFTLLVNWTLIRSITDPIENIKNLSLQLAENDLTLEIPEDKNQTEIGELNRSFKKFVETLKALMVKLEDQSQRLLETSQLNYEAIFNSTNDGIITLSSDYDIIRVNHTISEWCGVNPEDIEFNNFFSFFSENCPLNKNIENILSEEYNSDSTLRELYIRNVSNDTIYCVVVSCSPIINSFREKENYVIVLLDITKLKDVQRIKENFIATLTHDLKVPLLAEHNTLNFLLKGTYGKLEDKQKLAVTNMINSNNDLLALVNTLLDVYKYEAINIIKDKAKVDIVKLVEETVKEIGPLAEKDNKTIKLNISPSTPSILANRGEIKRVLINIIGNAISYTNKDGFIRISSRVRDNMVQLQIEDNGNGIPEKDLSKIFDMYFISSKKFRKVGTGLGLYLSKQIILAHNGKIWAKSKVDTGSTFFIELPCYNND